MPALEINNKKKASQGKNKTKKGGKKSNLFYEHKLDVVRSFTSSLPLVHNMLMRHLFWTLFIRLVPDKTLCGRDSFDCAGFLLIFRLPLT